MKYILTGLILSIPCLAQAEIPSPVTCDTKVYYCEDTSVITVEACDNYIADWVTYEYVQKVATSAEKAEDNLENLNCKKL